MRNLSGLKRIIVLENCSAETKVILTEKALNILVKVRGELRKRGSTS